MKRLIKFLLVFSLAMMISFIRFAPYAQAFSTVNSCVKEPGLCALIGEQQSAIVAQPTGSAIRNLAMPLLKNPIVPLTGAALALYYLQNGDYDKLRQKIGSVSPEYYAGHWYVGNSLTGARITDDVYGTPLGIGSIINSRHDFREYLSTLGWGYYSLINQAGNYAEDYIGSTNKLKWINIPDTAFPVPAGTPSIGGDDILDAAAAAAAAAAKGFADSEGSQENKNNAALAAAAAIAAAGITGSPSAQQSASDASVSAAAAGVKAAAKEEQDRDKAAADARVKPKDLPEKKFTGSTNFLVYAVTAFSSKFPFDIVFGGTDASLPVCPLFTLFYYKWQLCFLMPLFLTIRWIVFISVTTKVILEL